MMIPPISSLLGVLFLAAATPPFAPAPLAGPQDGQPGWSNWRGPEFRGTAPGAEGLPTRWTVDEHVVWRTPMPTFSGATPAISGDHLFVLSASPPEPEAPEEQPKGRRRPRRDPGGPEMLLHCLSTTDGSVRWTQSLDEGNELHYKANRACASPVTDGAHVWTVTGNGTVSAHDFDGELAWSTNLQERWGPFGLLWGYASSPVLHDGLLIVQVLHGMKTDDPSYIAAFDAKSGELRWYAERPTDAPRESPDAYTTPLVIEREGGAELVITGGDVVTGHALDSGKELWRVDGLNPRKATNYRIVPSAVMVGDILVAPTRERPVLAIDTGGAEPLTEEDVRWRWDTRGGPDVPTPASDGTHLYMVDDAGLVTCILGATGEALWGPERTVEGTVSSSPLLADGKLYITNEEGITVVLAAGPEFKQLAVNELDGSFTLSSPVAVGDRIYLRTGDFLYCLANPKH